jgi:NADH pyrophosphatase NudC (nudix superfamily)
VKFCSECGATVNLVIPDDDDRLRHVCSACAMVHYVNPKVIVGCLPAVGDKILLCKRAIEPRYGKWTLPCRLYGKQRVLG